MVNNLKEIHIQDVTPAYALAMAQRRCEETLPNFIKKDEWPCNRLDLNPIKKLC